MTRGPIPGTRGLVPGHPGSHSGPLGGPETAARAVALIAYAGAMSERLSMRKVREVLRLKYELGRSHAEIAASVGVGETTVGDYLARARGAGVDWAATRELDEAELEAKLFRVLTIARSRGGSVKFAGEDRGLRR